MDWLNGYVGRLTTAPTADVPAVDYSFVFGTSAAPVRHDPHVHNVKAAPQLDLLRVADLIRDRSAA